MDRDQRRRKREVQTAECQSPTSGAFARSLPTERFTIAPGRDDWEPTRGRHRPGTPRQSVTRMFSLAGKDCASAALSLVSDAASACSTQGRCRRSLWMSSASRARLRVDSSNCPACAASFLTDRTAFDHRAATLASAAAGRSDQLKRGWIGTMHKTTYDQSASPSANGSRPQHPNVIGESRDPVATIMLADDHRLVRSALRMVLEAEGWIEIVAEAGDVEERIRKIHGHKPDALVLDVDMPGGSGLEAIPRLLGASSHTTIVVLTMHRVPQFARVALRRGARAFVLKEAADTELIEALHAALDGREYVNPRLGAQIASEPPPSDERPDGLTTRQLQVLKLIVLGHTNREIAEMLRIGVRTVEAHRVHIQQRIGRNSRADLVSYARAHRLVD